MLISILPALILCFYTFPSPGDDYSNSISVFNEWQETHSFSFITVALKHAAERYMNWQGTLSACLIFALNPMIFSLFAYRLAIFLINIIFIIAVYYFSYTLVHRCYGALRYLAFIVGTCILFSFYHCVPYFDLFKICYWYTGATFYLLTFSLTLIFVSLLYTLYERKLKSKNKTVVIIILLLLSLFLGLNNLANALMLWSGLFVLLVYVIVKKHFTKKMLIIVFSFLTFALVINAIAPGNYVRLETSEVVPDSNSALGFFGGIIYSFVVGIKDLKGFVLISPVIGLLLISTPLFINANNEDRKKFINPIFLFIISYLIFISQYAPFLFSLGDQKFGRIEAMRFISLQFFVVLNYINFVNFISTKKLKPYFYKWLKVVSVILGILLIYHSMSVRILPHSHIKNIIKEYKSGKIERFINEKKERIRILEDDNIKDVEFKPMTNKVVVFGFDFTSEHKKSHYNLGLADYYNKDSVVVK